MHITTSQIKDNKGCEIPPRANLVLINSLMHSYYNSKRRLWAYMLASTNIPMLFLFIFSTFFSSLSCLPESSQQNIVVVP